MDFSDDYGRSAPWEKVTRKVIDPITFVCTTTIEYRPQLEECAFETTGPSISEPRFGEVFKRSTRKGIAPPAWSPPSTRTQQTKTSKTGAEQQQQQQQIKKGPSNSLGAFFQKSSAVQTKQQDADNMSVGSRSIASRSVADLSVAERSRTEEKLKRKAKSKKQKSARLAKNNAERQDSMKDIMEDTSPSEEAKSSKASEPPPPKEMKDKPKSCFPQKLKYAVDVDDDDNKSLTLDDVKIEKKLRWGEGHEEFTIDRITNSMYDDLFYGSEELADFRYEAFLEDAGLDADEYM